MNTLERTGRRDRLQRFSLAAESLGPIILGLVMVPATIVLAGIGLAAGATLGAQSSVGAAFAVVLRFTALGALLMGLLAPLFSSAGRKPADLVRLLLLPIPRSALFTNELVAGLTDQWNAVTVPMFLLVPLGLVWSERVGAALVALAAGCLFVVLLLGSTLLASTAVQLVVRDRRRAELLAVLLVFLPLALSIPAMLRSGDRDAGIQAGRTRGERVVQTSRPLPPPADGLLALVPSELYAAAVMRSATAPGLAAVPLVGLLIASAGVYGLSWAAYRRLLASPLAGSARETKERRALWGRRLPGLSTSASAVAAAEVRLALRTPRGRVILVTPFVLLVFFSIPILTDRGGLSFSDNPIGPGIGLSLVVVLFSLFALAPISLNQFAVDGAGLGLQLLAPICDRDVLAGKAVGLCIMGGMPIAIGLVIIAVVFPPSSLSLWLALAPATAAAFFVLAPIWAILSAAFPRTATLNSIRSNASSPHMAANLIGLAATLGATAPSVGLAALAHGVLQRADLVLPLVGLWALVAYGIGRLLFVPANAMFARRKENLLMVAQGR
jgi:hypothetical protein